MLLLAQQSMPDPNSFQSIGWLLVALAALITTANQVLKFFDRFKANPPLHKEYATKIEHDGLRGEFSNFRDEVRCSFDEAAQTSRQSREKIYTEQRRMAELLAKNNEKTDLTHVQVQRLDEKMDRILSRRDS